jgi:Spy/CpxP family protein refolding chaperone
MMMVSPPVFGAQDSVTFSRDSTRHKMWAQLGLSEDQKAKLKDMRTTMREFRKQNFEKMKTILDKSKEELLKQTPSQSVLYGYANDMGNLHREMSKQMADHMLKLKSILSKEQFTKLLSNEFRSPMPGGPHGHAGHDGPHGGGPGGPHDLDD